jgi:alkyldihydroxyacetonephosphate synthase
LDQARHLVKQPLNEVIAKVPNARLDDHPLIKTDPETRVRHARGQSLPDWLEMHSGNVDTFQMALHSQNHQSRFENF